DSEDMLVGGIEYKEARSLVSASIASLVEATADIDRIVRGLKDFVVPDTAPFEDGLNISAVARASAELVSSQIKKATSRFSLDLDPSVPGVRGNFHRLKQVMVNLLQNSCQAINDQSQAIVLSTRFEAEANQVVVVISDEGCGIYEELLDQLKIPFYTTKARSGGMGLGVTISNAIVEEHGGSLVYESDPVKGTRAVIRIPCAAPLDGMGR
ncbi:MAG: ATP-binding protein, partial [Spirochaetaceae bacterium]|nr:ATP-binding protein [Spirochaetaceae bacterium]